ncbi:MAG: hypothetical protein A3J83_06650 [Elusimicrobia bacterium RIFOXYA2_FULL_40_6]|nr:MAG: hypothetical protein A3J83_06650 [Elusimicrobia bacterium RIFOXYA2_FULL_40_6]
MFKILIVDDELDMCRGLSDILEEEGFNTIIANEGKTALDKVKNEQPDLVLLDLRLPGMDGLQILKKIKEMNKALPVIMVTGYGDVNSAVETIKSGALDYVSKPFDNEKVVSLVKKTLQTPVSPNSSKGILRDELMSKLKIKETADKPAVISEKETIEAKKKPVVKKIHLVIGLVLTAFLITSILSMKKDTVYPAPSDNPSEVMWDGQNIWSSDWFKETIYKHNQDETFSVAKTYYFHDNTHPIALCWGGQYIWSCDAWVDKIYVHKLNDGLSLVASYKSPSTNPSGLAWDGQNLWSCDSDSDEIYKHSMDNKLSVIAIYKSPSTNPSGLTWDGKNLWSCDSDSGKIYKYNMDSALSVAVVYSSDEYLLEGSKLTGLAWDGKYIWTCDEGLKKIYKHNFFRMKVKRFFGK